MVLWPSASKTLLRGARGDAVPASGLARGSVTGQACDIRMMEGGKTRVTHAVQTRCGSRAQTGKSSLSARDCLAFLRAFNHNP